VSLVYAVVESGGKQHRVAVGASFDVEKLAGEAGEDVSLERILLVADEGKTTLGTPYVSGARVVATIDKQFKNDKIIVFKFKAKKRYSRTRGHRQQLTRLTVKEIIV
jgi:large subunit ribosomal protein L21